MDLERASKRRKLDTPDKTTRKSTPASRKGPTPVTDSGKKASDESGHIEKSANGTKRATAQDAWAEAKARQRAARQIKGAVIYPEKDLYDDIDGAHPSPPKKAVSTTKKRAALDPLRNQRTETASSPIKKGVSSAGRLGFFKQFQKPRSETGSDHETVKTQGVLSGASGHNAAASPEIAETSDESSEDEVPQILQQKARGRPRGSTKKIAPSIPSDMHEIGQRDRKKTFEDEIKELEEAAKRHADVEGAETPRQAGRRRGSARAVKAESPSKDQRASGAYFKAKAAEKRRSNTPARDVSVQQGVPEPMEIDMLTAAPSTPSKGKLQTSSQTKQTRAPTTIEPDELAQIQRILLERLTGKRPVPLTNLDDEYAKVSQLVTQTITAGESNSMLLIGARGSGKTALVNHILREQAVEHAKDFHVVRLNGFTHTDDKIALREIWRQLGREMELGHESKNYADTLASLLALLSHPVEQGREEAEGQVTKSVVFILDEFDLFASHPRQTLLYNLFDIAQSRKAPIAVLGLTTRVDVGESLEKRVKSRFSHRYVHLSLAKRFPVFVAVCQAAMTLAGDVTFPVSKVAVQKWNEMVANFMSTDGMQTHLRRIYYTTKSLPDFLTSLLIPTAASFPQDTPISTSTLQQHFLDGIQYRLLGPPSTKLDLLSFLSTLQLALLICAARLSAIYATDVVSFNLVYEEYKVLASKAKLQASASGALSAGAGARVSGKVVAGVAWAGLVEVGLVMMEMGGRGGRVDVGLEEIGGCGVELGSWGRWCREI